MTDMYYNKLEEVDKKLDFIATVRDNKLKKLDKKYIKKKAKIMKKAAIETEDAMFELGLTIPEEVKNVR